MGNLFASEDSSMKSEHRSFGQVIDYIATHYILTMDFQSLTKLYEKEYCDELVVLTSDIIERNFNNIEITYLAQRIQKGVIIDKETQEKVIFFNKKDLDKMDVSTNLKKKRICIGIAKFYVKIAHLFAAIIKTINPVYSYKDDQGNMVKQTLENKSTIPKNVNRKIQKMGLCNRRIDALQYGQDYNRIPENGDFTVNPQVCGITKTGTQALSDEPGIPELMHLYCDKITTTNQTCDFTTMSDSAKKEYMHDLKKFYTAFTGNSTIPPDLQNFSQIKLREYKMCQQQQKQPPYNGNLKDTLFKKYAENLRKMVHHTHDKQEELLEIINELFTYDVVDDKKLIRVKPTLTEESLHKLVEKTRQIIVELYITCEDDFFTGVKLYEAIVENQILVTTKSQIGQLEKAAQEMIVDIKKEGTVEEGEGDTRKIEYKQQQLQQQQQQPPSFAEYPVQPTTREPMQQPLMEYPSKTTQSSSSSSQLYTNPQMSTYAE